MCGNNVLAACAWDEVGFVIDQPNYLDWIKGEVEEGRGREDQREKWV